MLKRPLAPIVFAVLAALAAVAGAGCRGAIGGTAIRVGDTRVSYGEFEDELDQIAGNEAFINLIGGTSADVQGQAPGSYSQRFVTYATTQRVVFTLTEQEFDRRGLELDDELRAQARGSFTTVDAAGNQIDGEALLAGFDNDYADQLIDDIARSIALRGEFSSPQEHSAWQQDAITAGDIEVSSRYGRWDASSPQLVLPPDGPTLPGGAAFDPLA